MITSSSHPRAQEPDKTLEVETMEIDGTRYIINVHEYFEFPKVPEAPPRTRVVLQAKAIVSVPLHDGSTKIVLFRPTPEMHEEVAEFMNDSNIDLYIEDDNGLFECQRPQVIVSRVYERGIDTMVVTTEDLNFSDIPV